MINLLGAVNLANAGPGGNWVNPLFRRIAHFATCVQCLQRGLTQFSDTPQWHSLAARLDGPALA